MSALETNREIVLNYKKQILSVLKLNYLELSNNLNAAESIAASTYKSENTKLNSNSSMEFDGSQENIKGQKEAIVTSLEPKDGKALAVGQVVPPVGNTAPQPTSTLPYDVSAMPTQGSFASIKTDGSSNLTSGDLPTGASLGTSYKMYSDPSSSQQLIGMMNSSSQGTIPPSGSFPPLGQQNVLKNTGTKLDSAAMSELLDQNAAAIYSQQYNSFIYNQMTSGQRELNSYAIGLPMGPTPGSSGLPTSSADLTALQQSYLYSQAGSTPMSLPNGATMSSPQYYMTSTGGTPSHPTTKSSKKSASASALNTTLPMGMNSYYPMVNMSQDMTNSGSLPIGGAMNGLPPQNQMNMLMNPALLNATLSSGNLTAQQMMNMQPHAGAAPYLTTGNTAAMQNNYFLNNTNNLLLSSSSGRPQTAPSSGSTNKVDVLGGNRLLLQQGAAGNAYPNLSLAQQQQMYNLGVLPPQMNSGMTMNPSNSTGNKKGAASLYNQIAAKPMSPYNPLMPGGMPYPNPPALSSTDLMNGMLANGMMMKPQLQRASSTGTTSKSKKGKQSAMNNMYGTGVGSLPHTPSLWEQIQPQPGSVHAPQMQMLQPNMQQQQSQQGGQQSQPSQQVHPQSQQLPNQQHGLLQPGAGPMNPNQMMGPAGMNMAMLQGPGGAYMPNMSGELMLQQRHEIAAQMAQAAAFGNKTVKQTKEGKKESRPSKSKGKDKSGGQQMFVNANGMMSDNIYALMNPANAPGGMPPNTMMPGTVPPGNKDGSTIKMETMVPAAAPPPPVVKPTKEEGVTALNKRRESVVNKLLLIENSKALGRRSVAVPAQCPPGGRRKVHGDYLLDEIQYLAIDYRQELRTKLSVLKSIAAACAEAVAERKLKSIKSCVGFKGDEEYLSCREQAKLAAHKMSHLIACCWSSEEKKILSQLHGKGNLRSLESVTTKLRNELFLPKVKELLAVSTNIKDIVPSEVIVPFTPIPVVTIIPESVTKKAPNSNVDRSVDRAIDKILKAKPLSIVLDTESPRQTMNETDDGIQLLPHQSELIDGIVKLSSNLSFGTAVVSKHSAGITSTMCCLIHNNWLAGDASSVDNVAVTSTSETASSGIPVEEIPLPVATVVVVITPRKRLFKWMSQYSKLYSPDRMIHYKPNDTELKITPNTMEQFVLFVCIENITTFMESVLFQNFIQSQQLCGVLVDIRGMADINGTTSKETLAKDYITVCDMQWIVLLANHLSVLKHIYRVFLSSSSYTIANYDIVSILAFLVPQITYSMWCSKYPMNKANLAMLDNDGDFLHTDVINRNTINQLICNISVQCKVALGSSAESDKSNCVTEEIVSVEMTKAQSFKYHAIASMLAAEAISEQCNVENVAKSVMLLQTVCTHEQFVCVYDSDSKRNDQDFNQPLMVNNYSYSQNMYMGVPYASGLSNQYNSNSTQNNPANDGMYLSNARRFSFTNQQQFQSAVYSPPHSSADNIAQQSGSSPMLLSGMPVYPSSSGMMMVNNSNNYVIPRHMSFDNNLSTTTTSTTAAATVSAVSTAGTTEPVLSNVSSGNALHLSTTHTFPPTLAVPPPYSPRRKSRNFAFYLNSLEKRLKFCKSFDYCSSDNLTSKVVEVIKILKENPGKKVLILAEENLELIMLSKILNRERILHLTSSIAGDDLQTQEIVARFNSSIDESSRVLLALNSVFSHTNTGKVTPNAAVMDLAIVISTDWLSAQSSTLIPTVSNIRNALSVSARARLTSLPAVKLIHIVTKNTIEEVMAQKHCSFFMLQGQSLEDLYLTVPSDVIVDQSTPTRANEVATGKLGSSKTFFSHLLQFSILTAKTTTASGSSASAVSPDRNTPVQLATEKARGSGFGGKGTILLGPQGTTTFMKGAGATEGPSSPVGGVKPKDTTDNEKDSVLSWLNGLKDGIKKAKSDLLNCEVVHFPAIIPAAPSPDKVEQKARSDSQSSEIACITAKIESSGSVDGTAAPSSSSVVDGPPAVITVPSVSSDEVEECLESCNNRILLCVLKESQSVVSGFAIEEFVERTISVLFNTDSSLKKILQLKSSLSNKLFAHYLAILQSEIAYLDSHQIYCPCNNSYDYFISNDVIKNGHKRFSSSDINRLQFANKKRCHVVSPQHKGLPNNKVPNFFNYVLPVDNAAYNDELIDSDNLPLPRCVYTFGEVLTEYQRRGEVIDTQLFVCPLVTACRGDTMIVPNHNDTTYDIDDTYNNVNVKYLIVKNSSKNGLGNVNASRKYRQAYNKKKSGADGTNAQVGDPSFNGLLDGSLHDMGQLDSEPLMMDIFGTSGAMFPSDFSYDPSLYGNPLLDGSDLPTGKRSQSFSGKEIKSEPVEGGSPPVPATKKRKSSSKKNTAPAAPTGFVPGMDATSVNYSETGGVPLYYDQNAAYSAAVAASGAPAYPYQAPLVPMAPRARSYSQGGGSFGDMPIASGNIVVDMANEGGWLSIEDDLIICMQNAVNDDDFTRTESWLRKSNAKRNIAHVRTAEEAKTRYKYLCESGQKDRRLLDPKVIGTISTLKKSGQSHNMMKLEQQQHHHQSHVQGQAVEPFVSMDLSEDMHLSDH